MHDASSELLFRVTGDDQKETARLLNYNENAYYDFF